jgi:hypothetical protein
MYELRQGQAKAEITITAWRTRFIGTVKPQL